MSTLDRRVRIHFGPDEEEVWGRFERESLDQNLTTTGRLLLTIRWNDRLDAWPSDRLHQLSIVSGNETWNYISEINRRPDLGRRRYMSLELEAPTP